MKNTAFILAAALLLAPLATFAALYHYVDTSGTVRSVEADSATAAIANAPDRAANSGVAVDAGVIDAGDELAGGAALQPGMHVYYYVDVRGNVRIIQASSAADALARAPELAAHSGVTLDTGVLENGDEVMGF